MTEPLARLEGLSYWYPGDVRALTEIGLEVGPGLTLVAGPSGGGKSSLLRVFNGLLFGALIGLVLQYIYVKINGRYNRNAARLG